jgi:hypothetical protein
MGKEYAWSNNNAWGSLSLIKFHTKEKITSLKLFFGGANKKQDDNKKNSDRW